MELTFKENIIKKESEPRHFHISVVIRVIQSGKNKFAGATAKAKFLEGVEGIELVDPEKSFLVKFTQESGVNWPMAEGIFDLDFDGEAWIDDREEDERKHCVRLSGTNWDLVKTRNLYHDRAE